MKYILLIAIAMGLVACGDSAKKESGEGMKFDIPLAKIEEPVKEEIPAPVEIIEAQLTKKAEKKLPVFKRKIRKVEIPDDMKQVFAITPTRDTVLTAKNGTSIKIPANAFVDVNGKPVAGPVEVEVVEAMKTEDILFANLSTTSNGEILQTGGMINITAESNDKPVQLGQNKSLDVNMPTKNHQPGMSLYYGKEESACVNWVDPVKIDSSEQDVNAELAAEQDADTLDGRIIAWSTFATENSNVKSIIWYSDTCSFVNLNHALTQEIYQLVWYSPKRIDIKNDSVFTYKGQKVKFSKKEFMGPDWRNSAWGKPVKGQNTFQTDANSNYVFQVKKLGWANIDRLYHDPRSKNVNMITKIENENEFDNIVITLVFAKENMFLPGYQKTDETFCFSHGDYEPQRLPVGAKASIVAIAYKDKVPYYAIKTFNISEQAENVLNLKQGTAEELKAELMREI